MNLTWQQVQEPLRGEKIDYCIRIDKVFNRVSKDYENILDEELDKCYHKL